MVDFPPDFGGERKIFCRSWDKCVVFKIFHIMFPSKQAEEVLNYLETHLAGSSQC